MTTEPENTTPEGNDRAEQQDEDTTVTLPENYHEEIAAAKAMAEAEEENEEATMSLPEGYQSELLEAARAKLAELKAKELEGEGTE